MVRYACKFSSVHTKNIIPVSLSLFFIMFFSPGALYAEPFYSKNLNPFVCVYGLPAAEGGEITQEGRVTGRLQIDMANSFTRSSSDNESIMLDGETYHAVAVFRYGLSDTFEIGLDLPYINHSGGSFDHFIDGWHDFFGLPDGNRRERERNLLQYSYSRNGTVQHRVNTSSDGIGDISISGGYKFFTLGPSETHQALTLRTALKLPTGSAEKLHGSKSVDLSLALSGTDNKTLSAASISLFSMLGGAYMGSGEVLNTIKKDVVGFGSVGGELRFWEKYTLKLQFDCHTPLYDSRLYELGSTALQIVFGGSILLSNNMLLDISMSEDLLPDTTPDIVLQIGLKKVF